MSAGERRVRGHAGASSYRQRRLAPAPGPSSKPAPGKPGLARARPCRKLRALLRRHLPHDELPGVDRLLHLFEPSLAPLCLPLPRRLHEGITPLIRARWPVLVSTAVDVADDRGDPPPGRLQRLHHSLALDHLSDERAPPQGPIFCCHARPSGPSVCVGFARKEERKPSERMRIDSCPSVPRGPNGTAQARVCS
jgi:hypothetical protein